MGARNGRENFRGRFYRRKVAGRVPRAENAARGTLLFLEKSVDGGAFPDRVDLPSGTP